MHPRCAHFLAELLLEILLQIAGVPDLPASIDIIELFLVCETPALCLSL